SDPSSVRKPRSRKWRAGAGIGLLLALAGAWLVWSHVAAVRLRRVVDQIRANHDSLSASDVNHPFVPDARNATIPLTKALSVFTAPPYSPSAAPSQSRDWSPRDPEWRQMAKAALAANPQSLALAHQAAQRPE